MKKLVITRWECAHCNDDFVYQEDCLKHEVTCSKNPERPCEETEIRCCAKRAGHKGMCRFARRHS